jgi:arabinofuranosyltransferase
MFAIGVIVQLVRAAGPDRLLAGALVLTAVSLPAVVEWTASGLENSLAMFLVATLALSTLRPSGPPQPLRVGLLVAALVLTRFDLVLIAMPLAAGWAWGRRLRDVAVAASAASVPVAAWMTWSWLAYGFVLPNTYYAKLNVDIPRTELFLQGISYVRLSLARHPLLTILLVVTFSLLVRRRAGLPLAARAAVLGAIALYLAYVVRIGGDFMEGRFFGVVVILALVGLGLSARAQRGPGAKEPEASGLGARELSGILIVAVLVALVARTPVPWQGEGLGGERWAFRGSGYGLIADERGFYVNMGQSFWTSQEIRRMEDRFRGFSQVEGLPTDVLVTCGGLGRAGLERGPSVHLIDSCALTDPLLARIPYVERAFNWRVGHYPRDIPDGYPEAIATGDVDRIVDEDVRARAAELWRIVRR